MPQLVLKVDVDTYRGTRIGMPRLVELLRRYAADATFLFSLGPDHTGRAIKRAFRPGFMQKVSRTSVLSHYGLRTLMYGTLLPGPDIGRRCADLLCGVRDAGFETGIHCWDHISWQDGVRGEGPAWTEREMVLAADRYAALFKAAATVHGAAGWQMNLHALRLIRDLRFTHASDCRGWRPFIPVWNGEEVNVPQLPTTLPTLDELIGVDGLDETNVHEHLLSLTREAPATGHVFTLHAELEGMKLLPVLEKLLLGWQQQGYTLAALRQLRADLDPVTLPRHEMVWGTVPGRSGELLVQGAEIRREALR